MPERYLVYNAGCHACAVLAEVIKDSSNGKVEIIDINADLARTLLDRATDPGGWKFAPYLVVVRKDRVKARTGCSGAICMGWLLGFEGLWRVFRHMRRANLRFLPRYKLGARAYPKFR